MKKYTKGNFNPFPLHSELKKKYNCHTFTPRESWGWVFHFTIEKPKDSQRTSEDVLSIAPNLSVSLFQSNKDLRSDDNNLLSAEIINIAYTGFKSHCTWVALYH